MSVGGRDTEHAIGQRPTEQQGEELKIKGSKLEDNMPYAGCSETERRGWFKRGNTQNKHIQVM